MKKLLCLALFLPVFAACGAMPTDTPTALPTVVEATIAPAVATSLPPLLATIVPPATVPPPESQSKGYANSEFGLTFAFPNEWFGPTEYVSDQMLRLEVGSDAVYPYGTDPTAQIYEQTNSYAVLIQYSKNDQNQYWKDALRSLEGLGEGEVVESGRGRLIKVRDLTLGQFRGVEYIATLSELAQTEPVYLRQIILYDEQPNVLTIMGTPKNVVVDSGRDWREVYRGIDEANLAQFRQIVDSIEVE